MFQLSYHFVLLPKQINYSKFILHLLCNYRHKKIVAQDVASHMNTVVSKQILPSYPQIPKYVQM